MLLKSETQLVVKARNRQGNLTKARSNKEQQIATEVKREKKKDKWRRKKRRYKKACETRAGLTKDSTGAR